MTREEFKNIVEPGGATEPDLIKRYVSETGEKVNTVSDLTKVAQKYPDEWNRIKSNDQLRKQIYGKLPEKVQSQLGINNLDESAHGAFVRQAFEEGKSIQAEVLKDYPDLSIKAGQNAVQKVIAEKTDIAKAMYRDELGPVSFYWGKEGNPAKGFTDGSGISHIIAKRNAEGLNGEEIAMMMPEVIAKGKVGEVYGPPRGQRVNVTHGDHEAVLSLYRHGNEETWLLTGWKEKTPGAPGVSTNRRDYARQTFGSRSDVGARVTKNINESSSGVKDKLSFAPEKDFRRKPIEEIEKTESAEMVKRSEIVDFLRQKLDVPIRTGRFRGKALGIFKIKPEVVRSKMANDIETISHEIGHALQKHLYPESMKGGVAHAPADWQLFGDELKRAATQPNKASDYGTEGFAEFIRMYVTDPKKAKTELPNFYDYFDKQLATKSPEAREILLHARDQYDKWLKQPAKQRVLSQISVGEKDYKRPINFTSLYTKIFDELHPLKKAVEAMAKGKDLKMAEDPYALARLMPGWTGKADAFLEYKPFNYKTYQFEGKSLKEILEPMKDNLDDFRDYIVSRRAVELNRRKIETGISTKDASQEIKRLHGKYGQAFKDLKEYQDRVLGYLADSGVLDKKALAKLREYNKDYVPFYRVMEEGKGAKKGTGRGLEAWSPIKKIKGSSRNIVDPLESIIKNTYLYINMAEKNAVGQALVRLAAKNEGMGKYVERIPTSMQKIKVSSEEMRNYMNNLADEVGVDSLPPEIAEVLGSMDIYRKSPFQPKENVISVWQNGKQTLYEVHPEIARTMQALDKESTNSLMRMLSIPSRLLRAGATLTPEFMARNPIRDQWTAYIYSKYGFKPGVDLFRGVAHMAGKDDIYWKWKISGGEHSMLVSMDREYLQKNLKDLMTKYGIDSPETYKYIVKHPIDTLRILSEFGEQGTRIGEFAKGIAKEGATKEGIRKAGFASREVTLDFARKGTWGRHVNQLVAFWNANMQGTDKMIRAFKEAPGATAFRVGASITLPSIGLYLYNRTDGRWEDIPQWQKDLFWVVIPNRISKEDWKKMSADDKAKMLSINPATSGIYRIPKPFEIGILFGSMPERLAEYILSQDPKAFDGYLKSAARGLSPGIMPNIGAPLVENWANKSFFFDRPLVPKGQEGLLPGYQAGPHSTETAKAISKAINRIPGADEVSSQTSPAGIENIIRGWTGGLGQHALNIVDESLKKAGVVPEKVKPSKSLSDIPFIKAFTVRYPSASAESIREFYDNYKKMDQTVSTARYLARKKFDPKEAAEVLEAGDIAQVNRVYQALQRQQQAINAINELPSITSEEKRRLIDTAYFQMIDVAKAGNEIFKKSKAARRR